MSLIKIAGRNVHVGDVLYHKGYGAWVRVIRYDPSGSAEVTFISKMKGRVFMVTEGGNINGVRQLFWHEPLHLDQPTDDVSKFQKLVDLAAKEF